MSLRVAVQMDPLESINISGDSTFAIMLGAQARGYSLYHYLADDLTYTHSNGETDTKKVYIDNLSGARKYHKIEYESLDARMYANGNAAVATAVIRIETSQKGGPVNPAHLRVVHMWVHQKGRWQLAAHQSLRLPNVVPSSRDYSGANEKQEPLLASLNVEANQPKGDYVVVDKSEGTLKVYQGEFPSGSAKPDGKLVAQFPVTTGSEHDPLPLGNWKVTTYSFLPPFHYQPDLFWDVSDDKEEQKLPPGPNGLVGVAWLDLSKENYGIHGTNEPQTIGRAESHGCIRMTNWDVLRLARMMKPGLKAVFQA